MGRKQGLQYRKRKTYLKPKPKTKKTEKSTPNEESETSFNVHEVSTTEESETSLMSDHENTTMSTSTSSQESEAYFSEHEVAAPSSTTENDSPLQFGLMELHGDSTDYKTFSKFSHFRQLDGIRVPIFSHVFHIHNDGSWQVEVHGVEVPKGSPVLTKFSDKLDSFEELFKTVLYANVCPGNPDDKFEDVCRDRNKDGNAVFTDKDGNIVAREVKLFSVSQNGKTFPRTVRHVKCPVIIRGLKCEHCVKVRDRLKKSHRRLSSHSDRTSPSSHVTFSSLRPEELKERLRKTKASLVSEKAKTKSLCDTVVDMIEKDSILVSENQHNELTEIVSLNDHQVETDFPEDSIQRLLWQQQKERATSKTPSAMRWHPMIIRWCMQLKSVSRAAYEYVHNSGFLALPSQRTLYDYENHISLQGGCISAELLKQNMKSIKWDTLPEHKKNVVLLFDEMKIKSDLIYSKKTGELVGFCNTGLFNQQLANLGQNRDDDDDILATHILLLMVQAVTDSYCFSLCHYPCIGFNADQLYSVIWEAVGVLEAAGFKVRATVSDGATPNRRFYRIHAVGRGGVVYRVVNSYAMDRRFLYFIADAPHLMKTTRNCWENSGGNKNTRRMMLHEKPVLWTHLTNAYYNDINRNQAAPGLMLMNKLSQDHIDLRSFSRMRVNLAVQWISKEFLGWIDNWLAELQQVPGWTKTERNRACLSRETIEGWRITGLAFPALCKELLCEDGVDFILSERLCCQDNIEQHFAKHRKAGGNNNAPTVGQFTRNEQVFQVVGQYGIVAQRGNCRRRGFGARPVFGAIDNTKLPKRPRNQ